MPDDFEIRMNPNLEREIKEEAQKHVRENCYIVVKRSRTLLGRRTRYEIVDTCNVDLQPGQTMEDLQDETFEASEIFGGDPDVRKIRIVLDFKQ